MTTIKKRIYKQVTGSPRISKLFIWNEEHNEYAPPPFGKNFRARRYNAEGKREEAFFSSLKEAREWQNIRSEKAVATAPVATVGGPTFLSVIKQWREKRYPDLKPSTRINYDKTVRLHFDKLLPLKLYEINSQCVDEWISHLKQNVRNPRRFNFRHELEVLSAIMTYYREYHDDVQFQFPIKDRHWKDIGTGRVKPKKAKDLTENEFRIFHEELVKRLSTKGYEEYRDVLPALATVQYYEALRISEAAGLHHEDVKLNRAMPQLSRLKVKRSVFYARKKGVATEVVPWFKNSKQFEDGVKELPVFPQAYEALAAMVDEKKQGLLFAVNGEPIRYRVIQYHYDCAFKAAGLPYTATHVMRHGWTREIYNAHPDMDVAKELLGDSSDGAAKVYAVRRAGAISGVAKLVWETYPQWVHLGANSTEDKSNPLESAS